MITNLILAFAPLVSGGPQYKFPIHTPLGGAMAHNGTAEAIIQIPASPVPVDEIDDLWVTQGQFEVYAKAYARYSAKASDYIALSQGSVSYISSMFDLNDHCLFYVKSTAVSQWSLFAGTLFLVPGESYAGQLQRVQSSCFDPWYEQTQQTIDPDLCWSTEGHFRCYRGLSASNFGNWNFYRESLADRGDGLCDVKLKITIVRNLGDWYSHDYLDATIDAKAQISADHPIYLGYQVDNVIYWYEIISKAFVEAEVL